MKQETGTIATPPAAPPAGSPRPRPRGAGRRWRIWLLLLAPLAGVALAELGARTYIVRFMSQQDFSRFASLQQVLEHEGKAAAYARHTYLGYYPRPGFERFPSRHNALGFRGEELPRAKPPGELRIVCIGGSTTFGMGVAEHDNAYPALLQAVLRRRGHDSVRVVNAGCNAWTTYESLINLHLRVLDLEPDLLLVLHSAGDIQARLVWPPEHYLGDNSGFRGATAELFMPGIQEYSALWRLLAVSRGWMVPHASIERSYMERPPWFRGNDFHVQVLAGSYPSGLFVDVPAERILEANPPVYYERNMTEMARTAVQRGIGCVLASFPYLTTDPGALSATAAYRMAYAEHEEIQQRVAREVGAHYFDLRAVFPADPSFFTDDVHMTAQGNRQKAVLFADYLEAQGLLPR